MRRVWSRTTGVLAAAIAAFLGGPAGANTADCGGCTCTGSERLEPADAKLRITYYGVSTLLFSAGDDQILIDGFFSRPGALETLLGRVGPDEGLVRARLRDAHVRRLRAVLVAHGHHDHALDAAFIARETEHADGERAKSDALVIGTEATGRLARANGLDAARTCDVGARDQYVLGPFKVTAYRADHGPAPWFLRLLLTGEMARSQTLPARFYALKDTQTVSYLIEYGARRIFVHPSAGALGQAPPQAELVFLGVGGLGIAGRRYTEDYWRAFQQDHQPRTFIPIHWDRFTRPLEAGFADPPAFLDRPKTTFKRIARVRPATSTVCFLAPLEGLDLPAHGPPPAVQSLMPADPALRHRPGCRVISRLEHRLTGDSGS